MKDRNRILLLSVIIAVIIVVVVSVTLTLLFRAALSQQQARLVETVQSRARLIEAIARFDARFSSRYPGGAAAATLSQMVDAHENFRGFGETGEFTLARRVEDQIVFLLRHRHLDLNYPVPVPFDSELAEPMRRALSGDSGTVIGLDYRGQRVLAAYEPVAGLDLGVVAKIDLAEIRAPFYRAGLISILAAVMALLVGVFLFFRITNPMLTALSASRERYRLLFDLNNDAIFTLDLESRTMEDANPAALRLYGYTRREFLSLTADEICAEDDSGLASLLSGIEENSPETITAIRHFRGKDGSHFPGEITASLFTLNRKRKMIASIRDITQRRESEERVNASLVEKEVMLKEIHHRVKNNMQVITSFLNLQAGQISDSDTREIFRISQSRIKSMALIHESLYEAQDLSQIDFGRYLARLLPHLSSAYQLEIASDAIVIDVRDVLLDINRAVPCGLIITELVSNALEHAFPDGTIGEIRIMMTQSLEGKYMLEIRDSGIGIPKDLDLHSTTTLGMQIVMALVRQLGGAIQMESGNGTVFHIAF